MADLATLKVKVDAADAVKQTKQLGDELKKTAAQGSATSAGMKKTEAATTQAGQAAARTAVSYQALKGAMVAVAGSMVVREMIQFLDAATLVEARLKLVTKSAGELRLVEDSLFKAAQNTRSSYEDVAGLYVRVARNMDTLGKSQRDLLTFTELVNMQLQIAGATTQEASSGVMQLGQALSKGKLDGDEFRTVLEAMPTVADALTKALAGGVRAELFALAKQGKITGKDIIEAILKMESETRTKFEQMPRTISQAFTQSKNDILKALGEINTATDSTISKLFQSIARVPGYVATGAQMIFAPTPEQELNRLDKQIASLREVQNQVREGSNAYKEAEAKIVAAQTRINAILAEAKEQADANAKSYETAAQAIVDATQKEAAERKKAWLEERARAEERKRWEEEEIVRNNNIAFARARARMEAGGGIPTATAGVTRVESRSESVRAELARQDAERAAARERQSFESRVRGAAFGGVDIKAIVAKALPELSALQVTMLEEKLQLETDRNKQIAQNFQENMQRAFGDILTEFVTTGKVSVREIFGTLRQMGGSMVGQGISSGISNLFGGTMTAMQSILTGGAMALIGGFAQRALSTGGVQAQMRAAERRRIEEERVRGITERSTAQEQAMREALNRGALQGRGRGVIQSAGTVLQETTASRMIGELVAIRVATTRTADAVSGNGSAAGTTVNVTVQGGMAGDAKAIGTEVAEAVDRLLGSRVQALRLTSGSAVTT